MVHEEKRLNSYSKCNAAIFRSRKGNVHFGSQSDLINYPKICLFLSVKQT